MQLLLASSAWQSTWAQEDGVVIDRILEPLEEKPADHILDSAGILNPEQRQEILRIFRFAKDQFHVESFVATYKVVPDRDANERAQRLRAKWEVEERSMLILYDRLNHAITFSMSDGMSANWSSLSLQGMMRGAMVESRELLGDDYQDVTRAGELLTQAIVATFENRQFQILALDFESASVWEDRSVLLINGLALLTILALGVVGVPMMQKLNANQVLGRRRAVFPAVRVPMRLGGIYSGGLSASIASSSPRQDSSKAISFDSDDDEPTTGDQGNPE